MCSIDLHTETQKVSERACFMQVDFGFYTNWSRLSILSLLKRVDGNITTPTATPSVGALGLYSYSVRL